MNTRTYSPQTATTTSSVPVGGPDQSPPQELTFAPVAAAKLRRDIRHSGIRLEKPSDVKIRPMRATGLQPPKVMPDSPGQVLTLNSSTARQFVEQLDEVLALGGEPTIIVDDIAGLSTYFLRHIIEQRPNTFFTGRAAWALAINSA
jgi:hypothetical protein